MTVTQPTDIANHLRNLALRQMKANQPAAAQATFEALLQQAPEYTPASLEVARLMADNDQWRASSAPLLAAVDHLPRHAPLLLKLTQELMSRGEVVAARQCLDFLALASEPPASLLLAQAHLRFRLGEILPARALVERALAAGADDPDDHYLHAMMLQYSGDLDGACRVLVKCLERWPAYGDPAVELADLYKHAPGMDLMALVDKQLARPLAPHASVDDLYVRAHFEYARFKLLDDAGRHADAWPALAQCNALMHERNPYDAAGTQATIDALIRHAPTGPRPAPAPAPADDGPTPIFIVGMPRSGTTLLERILSSHSQVASAGELYDFGCELRWATNVAPKGTDVLRRVAEGSADIDYAQLGARYLAQTRWRAGDNRYYVDKLPANIELVAFIRQALPQAPIVHIHRPPMDVCFSNFKAMFSDLASFSYDQAAVAHFYLQYRRLVAHWQATLPDAMLDVAYADLVGDMPTTVERILKWCGLAMEDACLSPERNRAPAATPSNVQVREPVHRHGNDRWRAYADQLQPLHDALAQADTLDGRS